MDRLHRSGFGRKASPDPSAFQLIEHVSRSCDPSAYGKMIFL
jgi:hypothetical protein